MKRNTDRYLLYLLLSLLVISLFHHLDFLPLKFEEPRRALVSLEMIRSGDWLHPSIYGLPYHNKPPLYNWVLAVFIKLFGYADWVIRLPTVLSLIGIASIHFLYFRKKVGSDRSLWSGIFLITSVNIYYYFSFQGEIDMFFALLVYLQMLSIIHFWQKEKYWHLFLWSYFWLVLGVLTKGLPSIGFQGLTLIGFAIYFRKFRWFFSLQHLVSGLLAVFLIGTYFVLYDATGGQAEYYLSKVFFEGSRRTVNHQGEFRFFQHFLSFIPLMIYLLCPWVAFAVVGYIKHWRVALRKRFFNNYYLQAAGIFVLFNLPLYWISAGTRDRYLYMFLPFFFLLIYPWVKKAFEAEFWKKSTALFSLLLAVALMSVFWLDVKNLQPLVTPIIASFVVLVILSLSSYKGWTHQLNVWLGLLIVLRFFFNVQVLDVRYRDAMKNPHKQLAMEVSNVLDGKKLFYYAPISYETVDLPLMNTSLSFPAVERLHYSFTYYFDQQQSTMIQHHEYLRPQQTYILDKQDLPKLNHNLIHEFQMNGKTYCIIET